MPNNGENCLPFTNVYLYKHLELIAIYDAWCDNSLISIQRSVSLTPGLMTPTFLPWPWHFSPLEYFIWIGLLLDAPKIFHLHASWTFLGSALGSLSLIAVLHLLVIGVSNALALHMWGKSIYYLSFIIALYTCLPCVSCVLFVPFILYLVYLVPFTHFLVNLVYVPCTLYLVLSDQGSLFKPQD